MSSVAPTGIVLSLSWDLFYSYSQDFLQLLSGFPTIGDINRSFSRGCFPEDLAGLLLISLRSIYRSSFWDFSQSFTRELFLRFSCFPYRFLPGIPAYVSHIFTGSLVEFLPVFVTKLIPGFILLFFPGFLAGFLLGCSPEYLQEFFSWYSWSSSENFNRSLSWDCTRSLVWDLSWRHSGISCGLLSWNSFQVFSQKFS